MLFNTVIGKVKGKKAVPFIAKLIQAGLSFIKELMETGQVVPVMERKYALSETPDAIRYIVQGHAQGKVVVRFP